MLNDDRFLRHAAAPEAEEPRIDWKRALKGAGDPFRRQAQDFWQAFEGVPLAPGQDSFEVGQRVAYRVPSGGEYVGTLSRPAEEPGHWVVAVDDGVSHIVPQTEMYPTDRKSAAEHRAALKSAARRTNDWYEVRSPSDCGDGTQTLLLDIGMSRAAASDLESYVAIHHNAELLDADIKGRRAKLLIRALDLPQHSPSEPTTGQEPGIETETMEGTGGPVPDMTSRAARLFNDPHVAVGPTRYDEAGAHTDVRSNEVSYTLTDAPGGRLSVVAHTLAGEVPCRVTKQGQVEPPYSSGQGPLSVNEDHPDSAEDGDYVVKAKTDKKTRDYWRDYYKQTKTDYGEKLTREVPRRVKTKSAHVKQADQVQKQDVVDGLMQMADRDEALKQKLSKWIGEFLSGDAPRLLDRIDPTIYPKLLFGMLSSSKFARKLSKEYGRRTTSEERVDLGPDQQRQRQQQQQPAQQPAQQQQQQFAQQTSADQKRKFLMDRQVELVDENTPAHMVERIYEQYQAQGGGAPTPGRQRQSRLKPVQADRIRGKEPLGNVPRMNIDRMTAQGGYLCLRITWDPESCGCQGDLAQKHDVETFVKFVSAHKEDYPDIGFIGKPAFKFFDPEAGVAELLVASSRGTDFPQEFFEVGGVHNTTRA